MVFTDYFGKLCGDNTASEPDIYGVAIRIMISLLFTYVLFRFVTFDLRKLFKNE